LIKENQVADYLNITPKRLEALKHLASKPKGLYVSALADAVLTSAHRTGRGSGFSRQQATRSGAGCALPLIRAGYVWVEPKTIGWGVVHITDRGRSILAEKSQKSLDEVLALCIDN
jgi:hypothetical protein